MGSISVTEPEARLDFAVGLFADGKASLGKAAEIAGVPYLDFMRELGRRHIPLHTSVEDLRDDVDSLRRNLP
jgi:predicted HTH domain antitoxin